MSLKMLTLSKESGVDKIVATPHFMKGRFNCEYKEVVKNIEELQNLAEENGIDIKIYCGQEVYYSENLLEYYNEGVIGTINNSKYMLIELPMVDFNLEKVIFFFLKYFVFKEKNSIFVKNNEDDISYPP